MRHDKLQELFADAWDILQVFVSDRPCSLNTDGFCIEHGIGRQAKGTECPQARIKKLVQFKAKLEEIDQYATGGTWPKDCQQRAFVAGAAWGHFHHLGATMFPSERAQAEAEAIARYGDPVKKSEAAS